MNVLDEALPTCVNHPSRETALRCGKCGNPICTKCVIQTPVGGRCRTCANMRRLPQYEVDPGLFALSAAGGLGVSLVGWYLLDYVPSLRFFLSIFVGLAIGEVMSRLARRRSNLLLESIAVAVVVAGFVAVARFHPGVTTFSALSAGQTTAFDVIPLIFASVAAVVKLR